MPFKLFTSNRLEILSDLMVDILSEPIGNPLTPETIVVQSRWMERWVSLQIASKLGICSNIRFPFPNTFIYEIIRKVLSDLPDESVYDPKIMTWMIMQQLPECLHEPAFEPLRRYLVEPASGLKRLQLATRASDHLPLIAELQIE